MGVDHPAQIPARGDEDVIRRAIGIEIEGARHHLRSPGNEVGFPEQPLPGDRFRNVPKQSERQVGPPVRQRLDRVAAGQRQDRQAQPRRLPAQPGGQLRDQDGLLGIEGGDLHLARRRCGVEGQRRAQRPAERFDRRRDRRFEGKGDRRRLHPVGTAQEQVVPEDLAQPFQRLADRRLRQAKLGGDPDRLAVPEEAQKDHQQRQVQPPEFGCA